ncbi:MAG: sigma 54-interacting transcriptional regulator [Tissierellales bacterium]
MDILDILTGEPDCSALLKAILDSIHDGVYILNGNGEFILVNKSVEDITQYERNKLYGVKATDLVKKGLLDYSITEKVINSKEGITELQTTYGPVVKEVMVTSIPILDDKNNIKYIVANLRDITELNRIKMEREAAKRLIEEYNLEQLKNEYVKNNIIAKSNAMKNVLDFSKRASQSSSTIVLYGESGSGKEVIAKFIHSVSPRKKEPFISINCAAIPANLLESELFGYDKGAFTDADKKGKIGLFELADNGTLLLDEINSLPLVLQGKILKFIETQELTRVGSTKVKKIDVRMIAATNEDLKAMVSKGDFRKDLYFRLNVIPIEIPPLRKRKEDILPLCTFFLDSFNRDNKINKKLSSSVLDVLESYEWPGNVRELRNIIERLVVMCLNDVITLDDLPPSLINKNDRNTDYNIVVNKLVPLKNLVDEAEKTLFLKAVEELKTTRKVAEALDISQTSVVRKMNQYNIK